MSSITELEFIQLLHQTRNRFAKSNYGMPKQEIMDDKTNIEDDEDEGLVMKLDSRVPAPANICSQSKPIPDLALTSAFMLNAIPDILLKKFNQVTELVKKKSEKLLPLFLYASLVFLGFQALAVIILLSSTFLSIGLLFLLTCTGILGALFVYTCSLGQIQQFTPPPSPSHSSASLCLQMS